MHRAIVFIDGSNFYHNVKLEGIIPGQVDFLKLSELVCQKFNAFRTKTIYYSSIPDISVGQEAYYGHMKFLSKLKALPNFEVKSRKLQKISNRESVIEQQKLVTSLNLCEQCKIKFDDHLTTFVKRLSFREKGIDVSIAVDMLEKAIKNECDYCILISGDADFIPVMNLIKENGKMAYSASVKSGYSSEMRRTQKFIYLKYDMLLSCLRTDNS